MTDPKVRLNRSDAVLVIDVINDLEFSSGDKVLPWAERLVRPLLSFLSKARHRGVPVIYVNDNFGEWSGDKTQVIAHCTRKGARGREVSRQLAPRKSDYVILKPRHSAFFCTPLLPLLENLEVERLVLAGMATNLCVLLTAHDALMHGYPLVVLSDCCAAENDFDHNVVLRQLQSFFDANVCRSTEAVFAARPARRRVKGKRPS